MGLSRQTWMAFWLAVTLGVATWGWCAVHPDDCARFERGDGSLPSTQEVSAGRSSVTVPCGVWLPRQAPAVQVAVGVDGILGVILCFSFWADARRAAERRRRVRF